MFIVLITSLVVSLVTLFLIFSILAAHRELVVGPVAYLPPLPEGHNAILEPFFLVVEHRLASLARSLRHRFYAALIAFLDRFVPWFRQSTKRFESRLTNIVQTVKGKRELNYLGRNAASPHIKNMRDHHDEVMKTGGSIEG